MNIDRAIERLTTRADDDPDAEWKAAIELGAAKPRGERVRAAAALTAALRSGRAHALIRAHAVESLGKLGLPRSAQVLTEALADPYRLVRSYAAAGLARLKAVPVEPLLRSLRYDEFFGVRAEAAKSLGHLALHRHSVKLRKRICTGLGSARRREMGTGAEGAERVCDEIDRALTAIRSRWGEP
jgi:HEAT repeat protein